MKRRRCGSFLASSWLGTPGVCADQSARWGFHGPRQSTPVTEKRTTLTPGTSAIGKHTTQALPTNDANARESENKSFCAEESVVSKRVPFVSSHQKRTSVSPKPPRRYLVRPVTRCVIIVKNHLGSPATFRVDKATKHLARRPSETVRLRRHPGIVTQVQIRQHHCARPRSTGTHDARVRRPQHGQGPLPRPVRPLGFCETPYLPMQMQIHTVSGFS